MKKRILCCLVAIAIMLAIFPAYATSGSLTKGTITGGASQRVSPNCSRTEPNSMDVHISYLDFNGQEEFRFAGHATNGDYCTVVREIYGTGYRGATYTSSVSTAFMKMSIKSSVHTDELYVDGTYAI